MSFSVLEIQSWIKARAVNEAVPHALLSQKIITGVAPLEKTGPTDLAFFFSKHYQNELLQSKAGAIVTGTAFAQPLEAAGIPQWKSSVFLACDDPYGAMATISKHFSKIKSAHDHQSQPEHKNIHLSANIYKKRMNFTPSS